MVSLRFFQDNPLFGNTPNFVVVKFGNKNRPTVIHSIKCLLNINEDTYGEFSIIHCICNIRLVLPMVSVKQKLAVRGIYCLRLVMTARCYVTSLYYVVQFVRMSLLVYKAAIIRHTLAYVSVTRPVLEYVCPLWHTNLNRHVTERIETVQKRALKFIYPVNEYADILCYETTVSEGKTR